MKKSFVMDVQFSDGSNKKRSKSGSELGSKRKNPFKLVPIILPSESFTSVMTLAAGRARESAVSGRKWIDLPEDGSIRLRPCPVPDQI